MKLRHASLGTMLVVAALAKGDVQPSRMPTHPAVMAQKHERTTISPEIMFTSLISGIRTPGRENDHSVWKDLDRLLDLHAESGHIRNYRERLLDALLWTANEKTWEPSVHYIADLHQLGLDPQADPRVIPTIFSRFNRSDPVNTLNELSMPVIIQYAPNIPHIPSTEIVDGLIQKLQSGSEEEKEMAANTASRLADQRSWSNVRRVVPSLVQALLDVRTRNSALDSSFSGSLTEMERLMTRDESAALVSRLDSELTNPEPFVRANAAKGLLAILENSEATAAEARRTETDKLIRMLRNDPSAHVREMIVYDIMMTIMPGVTDALFAAFTRDPNRRVRGMASYALQSRATYARVPERTAMIGRIEWMSRNGPRELRREAREMLEYIDNPCNYGEGCG